MAVNLSVGDDFGDEEKVSEIQWETMCFWDFWEYLGWMEHGHLSKFHVCGSLRRNITVWKNTSWRCTIWLKAESQAVVIPDCRKLRRRRDYRHGDVNCLSPAQRWGEQNEMEIGFRRYKKDTCFPFWIRLGYIKLIFYFLEWAFFSWLYPNYEKVLPCLLSDFVIKGKTHKSVLGLGGGLNPYGLGGLQCENSCIWATLADFFWKWGRLLLWRWPTAMGATAPLNPHETQSSFGLSGDPLLENTVHSVFAT